LAGANYGNLLGKGGGANFGKAHRVGFGPTGPVGGGLKACPLDVHG